MSHDSLRRKIIIAAPLALATLSLNKFAFAQGAQPTEGKQFIPLNPPQTSTVPNKIEVVEFFWYNCPHCFDLEPSVARWSKTLPTDVVLTRVPVRFQASHEAQQRLFYTLELMGVTEQYHPMVFNAIHQQRIPLNTAKQITDWITKQGLDAAKFTDLYNGFSVSSKATRATAMFKSYQIDGVPTFAVGGKFITAPSMHTNNADTFKTINFLISKVRGK